METLAPSMTIVWKETAWEDLLSIVMMEMNVQRVTVRAGVVKWSSSSALVKMAMPAQLETSVTAGVALREKV